MALVAAFALTACGGSSDSSSSAGTTESDAAPKEGTTENAASRGSSEVVAAAEKAAAPFFEPPKSIGITEPLKETPPTGKKIVAMACTQSPGCKQFTEHVEEAAGLLGWSTKRSLFTGAPEDNLNKITAAVQEHPDAIVLLGAAQETYEAAAELAAKEGVPIATVAAEGEEKEPFIAVTAGARQFEELAEVTANWFIAESEGKGNAITIAYAQFPVSERIIERTDKTIEEKCPECSAKEVLVQAEDTGTKLPSTIVSELQSDPDINYVIFQDVAMIPGVEAALREAGLQDKVKLMANNSSDESIKAVEEGAMVGNNAYSLKATTYQAIDAVARYLEGMPTKETAEAPLMSQIFTQENLPPGSTQEDTEELPTNLVEQYEELWKLK
jgi:ribose transport system substrate-binding protein